MKLPVLWIGLLTGFMVACVHPGSRVTGASSPSAPSAAISPEQAWAAWRAGDAARARSLGERLIDQAAHADEGHHLATLAAHVLGDHAAAAANYDAISTAYARRRELRMVVFESLLHAGQADAALRHAVANDLPPAARVRAELLARQPLALSFRDSNASGAPALVTLPFVADALTPYLPGIAGRVNGRPATLRLDTGGSFLAMSPMLATSYGVQAPTCAQGFANLQASQVCHGVVDLELGPLHLANAPVAVVASLPAEQLGVALGPVLGTNFLRRFLATVDAPQQRLLLSPRGAASAARTHRAALSGGAIELPFLLYGDHFLIARGGVGARHDLNFFIDSGLVAVADDGVQAGLLVSRTEATAWAGIGNDAAPNSFQPLPPLHLGGATLEAQRALLLDDRTWGAFGRFGGVAVHGLLSYGFLKHFAWTLDFDRQRIELRQATD